MSAEPPGLGVKDDAFALWSVLSCSRSSDANGFQIALGKDRRRYAAVEADKFGHGAIAYLSRLFGCGRSVIYHGLRELDELANGDPLGDRIRRPGAGRPVTEEKHPEVVEQLEETSKGV